MKTGHTGGVETSVEGFAQQYKVVALLQVKENAVQYVSLQRRELLVPVGHKGS